jgi:hypothetical protein
VFGADAGDMNPRRARDQHSAVGPDGFGGGGAKSGSRRPVSARQVSLDNLKVVLVAGVIVGHAAMTYGASGTWILEVGDYGQSTLAGVPEVLLSLGIALGALFAIGLFMLISGLLTPASARRKGPRAFALDRLTRLGVPVAAYVFVVWPALGVLVEYSIGDARGSVWSQYVERLERFDSGPMWFVAILLAFSLVYAAWARFTASGQPPPHTPMRARSLVLAAVLIAAASFVARLAWPIDTHQVVDLHLWLWPQCAVLFVFGIVSADRGWLAPVPDRVRRACGIAALAAVAIAFPAIVIVGGEEVVFKGGPHVQALLVDCFEGAFAVGMSVWCLGIFQRHGDRRGPLAAWSAPRAYGAFVAQGPVLVVLALALYPLHAPAGAKFLALAMGSVVGSFVVGGAARAVAQRV